MIETPAAHTTTTLGPLILGLRRAPEWLVALAVGVGVMVICVIPQ